MRDQSSISALRIFVFIITFVLSIGLPSVADAQETGRIIGRVVDARTGAGLGSAVVRVLDTPLSTVSAVDGRFMLLNVPAGAVSISVSLLGYGPKTVTSIEVAPGSVVEQDVALQVEAILIDAIEVTAAAERGSVNRALDEQRTATGVVNSVTAEQISKSPDGDAAQAVQRVSGVTVQDGKYVFVRGLGERYTTTSLNGARLPSPEPERKMVPLDLFPSGLLQAITASKTFTPNQPGDFSGAQVDIRTREFPAGTEVVVSGSLGFNSRVVGADIPAAPTEGLEWLGYGGRERSVPSLVDRAGNFEPRPTQAEVNRMVSSFRNAWSARERAGGPNGSLGLSVGGTREILGRRIGYLVSGTYSLGEEVRAGERRANALADGNGGVEEVDRFDGMTGRTSVLWGGLVNLSTLIGSSSRIAFNGTYNRTAENEARIERGSSENLGGILLEIDRLRFVERSVRSGQVTGEHQLGSMHRIDWSLTASEVNRVEPDRSEIVYAIQDDPATGRPLPPAWFSGSNEGAVRTYSDLTEWGTEASANYRFSPGGLASGHEVRVGGLVRWTDRDADNRAYSIAATLGREGRELPAEQIFDGRFAGPDSEVFRITPLSAGGSYAASDRLYAGYAMAEIALGERVRVVGGARVERSEVTVDAEPTIGAPVRAAPAYTDLLPSLAVNVRLSESQNLRFSASRTLSRPEYRELAGVQYREVIGGENAIGNPDLRRTLIQNYDARWEWYPGSGEVLSVALFAKRFKDPIERIYLATSGTRIVTFVNADGAENYGVELEARKNLGSLAELLTPLDLFANATFMRSDIRIGSGGASKTNDERAMVGQAPYVINAGLTFAPGETGISATVLYNVIGKRILSASEAPLPDVFEEARQTLDIALRVPVTAGFSVKFDAKNLLDSPYEVTQGTVVREMYRSGRSFTLGASWRP